MWILGTQLIDQEWRVYKNDSEVFVNYIRQNALCMSLLEPGQGHMDSWVNLVRNGDRREANDNQLSIVISNSSKEYMGDEI